MVQEDEKDESDTILYSFIKTATNKHAIMYGT